MDLQSALKTFFDTELPAGTDTTHQLRLKGEQVAGHADSFGNALRELRVAALGANAKDTFEVKSGAVRVDLNFTSGAFEKMRAEYLKNAV